MKDPNNTRDTLPRRGSPLWLYLVIVVVAGLAILTIAITTLDGRDYRTIADRPVYWMLAILIIIGELKPIITSSRINSDASGATASTALTFATLLYAGLPVAITFQVLATIINSLAQRRGPHRVAFNVTQFTLSFGTAFGVLLSFGIAPSPSHPWTPVGTQLPAMALAALAYFAVNNLLVNAAIALHERTSLRKTLRSDLPVQVLAHAALLGVAPLVAVTISRAPVLVPLFALPFIAVYLNASASIRHEHRAMHDLLTGLPNRHLLIVRTEEALGQAHGSRVGLFLLDLDRFKEVNDTLGHPTGDRLLQVVAHRLTHSVRPGDLVARLGGDEFAVLLPSIRDARAAREVAARLRAALNEPVHLDGMSFDIEASVGIALFPDHAPDFELLLQRADVAMYVAKEGRRGVEIYSPAIDRNSPDRLSLLGELRRGIDRGELLLYFQPKVMLADRRTVGMEALLRWQHPRRGLLTAEEFLPLAEQSYLMRTISDLVVETALEQLSDWWRAGLRVQLAINTSAHDLLDSTLTEMIASGLLRHDVPAEALQLEITERILTDKPNHAADTIDGLARLGISLCLDDFGTGYSSLVRLRRLPVDEVKIDASFIRDLCCDSIDLDPGSPVDDSPLDDPALNGARLNGTRFEGTRLEGTRLEMGASDNEVIVRSVIDLVRTLGLRSVAEGVEDEATARRLQEMGCEAAQGYLFAHPMAPDEATTWLSETSGTRVKTIASPPWHVTRS
jgi:diguanylate cyclase (GGDEF)-like protein